MWRERLLDPVVAEAARSRTVVEDLGGVLFSTQTYR